MLTFINIFLGLLFIFVFVNAIRMYYNYTEDTVWKNDYKVEFSVAIFIFLIFLIINYYDVILY